MTFFIDRKSPILFSEELQAKAHKIFMEIEDTNGLSLTITEYGNGVSWIYNGIQAALMLSYMYHRFASININARTINPGERVGVFVTVEPATNEPEHALRPEHRQEM